ncbi:hypothetical protein K438DRAFT_818293 [Mycena galopus ATCC 62051]|nr:hypothetical protein K438DRAFT_818293 [Mycena galopus ATCC 62051]
MRIFLLAIYASVLLAQVFSQGNTSCSGTQMDWYTGVVGETPCSTYQRLRQICNPEYQVGQMNSSLPPDMCTDQISGCCCNSIAFTLSMLCLNCQQKIGTGNGYDAPPGTMQNYFNASYNGIQTDLSHCDAPVFENLTANVQTGVCNEGIRILDDLYSIAWSDGACVYASEALHEDTVVEANNSFTKCKSASDLSPGPNNNTGPSTPSSSPSTLSSSTQGNTPKHLNVGAIAGTVVGAVGVVLIALWILWRRRRSQHTQELEKPSDFRRPLLMDPYLFVHGRQNPPRKGQNSTMTPSSTTTAPSPDLSRSRTLPPAYGQDGWPDREQSV